MDGRSCEAVAVLCVISIIVYRDNGISYYKQMKITINIDGELMGVDICHGTALLLTNRKMKLCKIESIEIVLRESSD